jgi:hypothetical protein
MSAAAHASLVASSAHSGLPFNRWLVGDVSVPVASSSLEDASLSCLCKFPILPEPDEAVMGLP